MRPHNCAFDPPAELVCVHAKGECVQRLEAGVAAAGGHAVAGLAGRHRELARVCQHARSEGRRLGAERQPVAGAVAGGAPRRVVHLLSAQICQQPVALRAMLGRRLGAERQPVAGAVAGGTPRQMVHLQVGRSVSFPGSEET